MFFCVDIYEYEDGEVGAHLDSQWFDDLKEAVEYADSANASDRRIAVSEEDTGQVVYDC